MRQWANQLRPERPAFVRAQQSARGFPPDCAAHVFPRPGLRNPDVSRHNSEFPTNYLLKGLHKNQRGRHSSIGYLSPVDFENQTN